MKKIAALSLLALSSCVHLRFVGLYDDMYVESLNKYVEERNCFPPVIVSFDSNMSKEDIAVSRKAMEFWSKNAGTELFIDLGVAEQYKNVGSIHFRNAYTDEDFYDRRAAVTRRDVDTLTGCIVNSEVIYIHSLGSFTDWEQDKIAQHEIGHALGFSESSKTSHVMYRETGNLRDVTYMSEVEQSELKRLYGAK